MATSKKVPMRQCVGCREMKPKKEMIRIIKTADNDIQLDAGGRKNGRGAYICLNSECLVKAEKTKGLSRSFKMEIPQEIYAELERQMREIETDENIVSSGNC